jgi:D-alanyl-D-alanine dipeptidase/CubicO group peptidase (beta-lactamase class C family)
MAHALALEAKPSSRRSRGGDRRRVSRILLRWVPRTILGLTLTLGCCPAALAVPTIAASDPYREAAEALQGWMASEVDAKGVPALSIALVDDHRIVWARGFGFADGEGRTPATAHPVYGVGAVAELVIDLALMQLVEQGRVDLDGPVTPIVPEFAPRNPFGTQVTLRHLMAHSAGLVREVPRGLASEPAGLFDAVRSLEATTLATRPGTRTKPSSAGTTVLAAVIERISEEPFAAAVERSVLRPVLMSRTSFSPGPELRKDHARGQTWTYDGQSVTPPARLPGRQPATSLVSTVIDLSRVLNAVFAHGRGLGGPVIQPETLRAMLTPQAGAAAESTSLGLGFALSRLEGRSWFGRDGAGDGFAAQVAALPEEKLGVVVLAAKDRAGGVVRKIADAALGLMLAAREGRPLPALESTRPVPLALARRVDGRYAAGTMTVDLVARQGKLYLTPLREILRAELRLRGEGKGGADDLIVDDCLAHGPAVVPQAGAIVVDGVTLNRVAPRAKPAPAAGRWAGLIGEYGPDHAVLYILENEGTLWALRDWFFAFPLNEEGPDRFRFPDRGLWAGESLEFRRDPSGRATQLETGGTVLRRRRLDGEDGATYRIAPVRPVGELRAAAQAARPPEDKGPLRAPDLVDLAALDPTIKLDIRYATANNFLGVPVYTSARAFLQRPVAEALRRAHEALDSAGYGLLIHDAYRPWSITRLFWDATPESGHSFVADPSQGSKHNRGAAVDLTLYDRATGSPAVMVGGYDEFSPRSNPDYPGGTSLQRWQRDLLRRAMEDQGFTVNPVEWWHFDFRDWASYPILNQPFEELGLPGRPR